ncbi:MAG: sulfotransferase, partial [Candidatus Dormibacteria bacterium]
MITTPTPPDLSAEALMDAVSRRAGGDDWGEGPFVDALRLLLSCAQGDTLNELGRRVLRSIALRHLSNRLTVQAFVRSHPDVNGTALVRPIVVTGLPRTGTTALQQLLVLDPAHRPLRLWEALRPVPAVDVADRAARVADAETWLGHFYESVPGFRAI